MEANCFKVRILPYFYSRLARYVTFSWVVCQEFGYSCHLLFVLQLVYVGFPQLIVRSLTHFQAEC